MARSAGVSGCGWCSSTGRSRTMAVRRICITTPEWPAALGHEVVLYGPPKPGSPFNYSLDVGSRGRGRLHLRVHDVPAVPEIASTGCGLVGKVPRQRRVVIDLRRRV